jgi:hypothetical protein
MRIVAGEAGIVEIAISELGLMVIVALVMVPLLSQLRAHGMSAPDEAAILVIL